MSCPVPDRFNWGTSNTKGTLEMTSSKQRVRILGTEGFAPFSRLRDLLLKNCAIEFSASQNIAFRYAKYATISILAFSSKFWTRVVNIL
jgi:hypothetical protein